MAAFRREQRSSACAICRQPALAGDRLCAPCRSALKRARDSTVSDAMTPKRGPRRRSDAPPPANASVAADPVATSPARTNWLARGIGFSLVAALIVAGGAWITHTRGIAGTIAPRYSIAPQESNAETIEAAAATRPAPAATAPADKTASAAVGHDEGAASRTLDARALPSSITMPRGRAETDALAAAAATQSVAPPPPAPAVEPALPPPIVVAQAPARPAPDRWQRLAAELERCPQETIRRAVCQESLRIEHCEGHWGRVAACPAKIEREYGN
ncbi:MAG TPA: hypothetical protein VII68_03685 [Casimicrobiaceae bacterium]